MFDPSYRMLGAGALGWSRKMIWDVRWEGGSGLGTPGEILIVRNVGGKWLLHSLSFIYIFLKYKFIYFNWRLFYNIVLVLPYINMNPPWVYMCSPSWTPLPPPSLYHPSGSSQCTSPEHPVSCIESGLAIHFLYDIIHVSMPFSQIIPPSPSPTES